MTLIADGIVECDPSWFRHATGVQAIQPRLSILASNLITGEARHFHQTDTITHRLHFFADDCLGGCESKAQAMLEVGRRFEKQHAFPAVYDTELCAVIHQQIIQRCRFRSTAGRTKLVWHVKSKFVLILFDCL